MKEVSPLYLICDDSKDSIYYLTKFASSGLPLVSYTISEANIYKKKDEADDDFAKLKDDKQFKFRIAELMIKPKEASVNRDEKTLEGQTGGRKTASYYD